jgi:hypothetical protein
MVPCAALEPGRWPCGSVTSRTLCSCSTVHGGAESSPSESHLRTTGGDTLQAAAACRTEKREPFSICLRRLTTRTVAGLHRSSRHRSPSNALDQQPSSPPRRRLTSARAKLMADHGPGSISLGTDLAQRPTFGAHVGGAPNVHRDTVSILSRQALRWSSAKAAKRLGEGTSTRHRWSRSSRPRRRRTGRARCCGACWRRPSRLGGL